MSSDSKQTKAAPAPKSAEAKTSSTPAKETASTPAKETPAKETAKTESSDKSDSAPANYSRGEGQKPVSAAYRENWNVIFGDKKPKKKKKR
jgi:hypothetical protein